MNLSICQIRSSKIINQVQSRAKLLPKRCIPITSCSSCYFSTANDATSSTSTKIKTKKKIIHTRQKYNDDNANRYRPRYGTSTSIQPCSKYPHPINHPLAPYIQQSIQQTSYKNNKYTKNHNKNISEKSKLIQTSQFNITFLGTSGGGRPNHYRNPSSTALKINGTVFLFDAGEGTQRQIAFSNLNVLDVKKIFITHMHIDHVGGLIPLILNIKLALTSSFEGSKKQRQYLKNIAENAYSNDDGLDNEKDQGNELLELDIYGPVGLFHYIQMNLSLTHSNLYPVKIIIHELVDEYEPNSQSNGSKQNKKVPTLGLNHLKITENPYLERRVIYKNKTNKAWTIQNHPSKAVGDTARDVHKHVMIEAAEVKHVKNVQTFGYVVTEPIPLPKIDVNKATQLNLKPSPKYRNLKIGEPVQNDDGTAIIMPHQVICNEGDKKGRKFVLIGDTCTVPNTMLQLSTDCDVLVHEATLVNANKHLERIRGHSTARTAGMVAGLVNAKVLLLNHISSQNDHDQRCIEELVRDAEFGSGNQCIVAASYDFMEIAIPRHSVKIK